MTAVTVIRAHRALPARELRKRVIDAVEDADREALHALERETTDVFQRELLRNADNLIAASKDGRREVEHRCAVAVTDALRVLAKEGGGR